MLIIMLNHEEGVESVPQSTSVLAGQFSICDAVLLGGSAFVR
jgi:hypothetical protein